MVYGIEHSLKGNALLRQKKNRIEQYKPNGGVRIKVAIYTRVSTQDQAKEGISLDAQLNKLKLYAESKDYDIYKVYTDAGYTGRNTNRPQYKQMLKDIDFFDGILTYKIDRIHRNRLNFITMMQQLRKKDKEFISMTENLDTSTAMGRFVMGIIQDIAQLESEQIGERVSMSMKHKAENGKGILGFYPPLGYDFKDGKLTVNQQEAKTIQEIFYMK